MCKICTFNEMENCNTVIQKSINLGLIKKFMFLTLWSEKDDNNKHIISATIESEHGEQVAVVKINMNYCPNCGRKLNT